MSLADRPVICKKVQEILSIWMQDSRFKAEGLRIQEVFWDLESWILDPMYLGKGGWEQTCKKLQFLITKKCPKF
jgi:hypothetical protein